MALNFWSIALGQCAMQGCLVDWAPPRPNSLLFAEQMCQSSWIAMLPHCRLHLFWHRQRLSPNSNETTEDLLVDRFLGAPGCHCQNLEALINWHDFGTSSSCGKQLVSHWRGRVRYENLGTIGRACGGGCRGTVGTVRMIWWFDHQMWHSWSHQLPDYVSVD